MGKLPKEIDFLISEITREDAESVNSSSKLRLGRLYLWYYPDPKYKDKLEVYDQIPLVMLLDVPDGKYILGLNLHYIPWTYRINFLKLIQAKGMKIKYADVAKAWKQASIPYGFLSLAIRKYLINRIRSNIRIFSDPEDQLNVARNVLPLFKKQNMNSVYKDINKKLAAQRAKVKQSKKVT